MLIVIAKSAAALVLGGAVLAQQGNQQPRDTAPPAPSAQPTPADARRSTDPIVAPQDNSRVIDNDRQTYQAPQPAPRDPQGRAALGVTLTNGLQIQQVMPGSPAERMGLRPGDQVLSLNGQTFNSVDAFIDAVGSTPQGQQARIEFDRGGQRLTQSGSLGQWDQIFYSGSQMAGMGPQGSQTYSAMKFPNDGSLNQGQPASGQFFGDSCGGSFDGSSGGGYYGGGYGYDGYGNGGSGYNGWGRGFRRARWGGGGYYW